MFSPINFLSRIFQKFKEYISLNKNRKYAILEQWNSYVEPMYFFDRTFSFNGNEKFINKNFANISLTFPVLSIS